MCDMIYVNSCEGQREMYSIINLTNHTISRRSKYLVSHKSHEQYEEKRTEMQLTIKKATILFLKHSIKSINLQKVHNIFKKINRNQNFNVGLRLDSDFSNFNIN